MSAAARTPDREWSSEAVDGDAYLERIGCRGEISTSVSPWRVRGVEVRGRAEAVESPKPMIRIYPERIISGASTASAAQAVVAG